ncbi:MAG: histone deacetylase family protein [Alphaproteobacteria bacterium]|nr:histone deacetylase family protein [Alphaproteobacteria bacterium]
MKTIYSPAHLAHCPHEEFEGGRLTPAVEVPERAECVLRRIAERKLGPVIPPAAFDEAAVLQVHDRDFVALLTEAHSAWSAIYGDNAAPAIASAWPARSMKLSRQGDIESRLGSFSFDTATPILRGTWDAARAAVDVALTGAKTVKEEKRSAFALTRPPGHHASSDLFGGYCYLNNAAIAADWLARQSLRIALLDVDYHHGNGSQDIFYRRSDVLFISIHADPSFAYPHFTGFADELGEGDGAGSNLNLPLPRNTDWNSYREALEVAKNRLWSFAPDVLLISLGLDTFELDPIAGLGLGRADYLRLGEHLADLKIPTLFIFEGGYNLDALGEITVNVLEAFEGH